MFGFLCGFSLIVGFCSSVFSLIMVWLPSVFHKVNSQGHIPQSLPKRKEKKEKNKKLDKAPTAQEEVIHVRPSAFDQAACSSHLHMSHD
uniref:Uncharacterized protein n=1 Tax=Knipowitschia caucasica TaxID=637954 RepID=A0AAV2M4D5_KNICA